MRILALVLSFTILLLACRPAKKVQKIQQAISKVDTTQVVVVAANKKTDSVSSATDMYSKVVKNNITFSTFNAKVRVQYEGKEGGDDATAFIRMKKDSLIWLSLRGALGIEGFRVLVTEDSVKMMNPLKKNIQYRSISYLQEITDMPLDFHTLQDLIVGNPVFIDSNIVSYTVNANNQLIVLMAGKIFNHLVTLDNSDDKILHSKLDDVNAGRNRTCDITFGDYENTTGFMFATQRKISIAEQSKLDINLDFKQYSFNQPLTFPFNIPKNYKRL